MFTLVGGSLVTIVASAGPLPHRGPSHEILAQIDAAKRQDPVSFADGLSDLDAAIRTVRVLEGPQFGENPPPRRIIDRGPQLDAIWTRAEWVRYIEEITSRENGPAVADFYRRHLDNLALEDTAPSPEALLHVVLNGWQDWIEWTHPRLLELRAAYPELHRVYAIRELQRRGIADAGPLLLDVLAEPSTPPYVWVAAQGAVDDLVDVVDRLQFAVDHAYSAQSPQVRERLQRVFLAWAAEARRAGKADVVLGPHRTSPITPLRVEANVAGPTTVLEDIERWTSYDAWIAENDPDPDRRARYREMIATRERVKARERPAPP